MGVYTKTVTYNTLLSSLSNPKLTIVDGYDLELVITLTADSSIGGAYATVDSYLIVPSAANIRVYTFDLHFEFFDEDYSYIEHIVASGALEGTEGSGTQVDYYFDKAGKYHLGSITMYDGYGWKLGEKPSDETYEDPPYIDYEGEMVAYMSSPFGISFPSSGGISISVEDESTYSGYSPVIETTVGYNLTEAIYELPVLHTPVNVTAPTTYLGDDMNIAVTKKSGYSYSITYTFGDLVGTVTEETTQTSITWDIPTEDFLAQFSGTEIRKDGILSVRSIYEDEVIFTENVPFIILLDSSAGRPTISPTIVDTNSTTIALTGNSSKIVKYYSNAQVTTGAKAQGAATITSVKTVCGSKSFTGLSGTISGPDSNVFTITATDTRGLTSSYTETLSSSRFVDYSKLSCNLFTQPTTTDGKLTFIIEGNCFYGSFGAVSNTLTVQYRYKVKDGTYSSWINASATLSSNSNYSKTITLTGLDYRTIYVIQARAIDKLATVQTSEVFSVGEPIFDWSKEDFNFNVPVSMQDSLTFAIDKGIAGTDEDGSSISALIPCDSTGNTVLGYGNYTNESGSTLIYGNASVDILSNGDITFNGQSLLGLVRAMSNSYTFTTTVTPGSNYNSASCALTLRGNCLYCRIYGSRAGASGTGDITDELIGKVSFNHGGKITGMDYVGAVSSQTGTTASIAMKNPSVSGDTATFDAYLTNSATAGTNFMATFVIPVSLNLNNF